MSLLRTALAAHEIRDTHQGDAPSILGLLIAPQAGAAAVERNQRAFDRETDECDAIVAARPVGCGAIPLEPKSIHSPAPRSRISREPPAPKRTASGRKRTVAVEDGLPTGRGTQSYHRPVRTVRWPGDEGY